ncbi:MAG: tRNA (adenosine(37)-N6)-threonylcarbamoyltransferase complex transferase subunit TsaD [Candidatus Omnitrophica bacterium]|nr:tRNA (adenosine(37)-N6)-threonylcarbamoyltransferase complex transferase subunit TsaD [Candidatus Omnitrophota bacterium]
MKKNNALILGIETSCDETSAAVACGEKNILSNVVVSSLRFHKKYSGVVPEIACRHHAENINIVLDKALKQAKAGLSDIKAVSVTQGPGLIGALLVGVSMAKALSYCLRIPIIPVNHLHGHLYAALLSTDKAARFPATGLVVSGGHTTLVHMRGIDNLKLMGQTRDDACGEAFDKAARVLGLGYPGGPVIEKLAAKGRPGKIRFTRPFLEAGSMDFSFSGIKTSVLNLVRGMKGKPCSTADICREFQDAVFDVIIEKTRICCLKNRSESLLVGGGVSANGQLRKRLKILCDREGIDLFLPARGMSLDNAAMIAALGSYKYNRHIFGSLDFTAMSDMPF